MKYCEAVITGDQICIHVHKSPLIILGLLRVILSLMIALPALAFILSLAEGNGPKAQYFIGLGISGFIAFQLWRIIQWNSRGVEVFDFQSGALKYWAEMGSFKDGKQELENLDFEWEFHSAADGDPETYRLCIWDSANTIYSVLNLDERGKNLIDEQLQKKHKPSNNEQISKD